MLWEAIGEWCLLWGGCNRAIVESAYGTVLGGTFLIAVLAVLAVLALAGRAILRRLR